MVHPDRPWPAERLERLQRYVEDGGRLLFVGELSLSRWRSGEFLPTNSRKAFLVWLIISDVAICPGRFAEVFLADHCFSSGSAFQGQDGR